MERAVIRNALAFLLIAVVVCGAAGLLHSSPVEGLRHTAVRSFSASSVEPGGRLKVTIAVANYGGFGEVVETLPAGFSFTGSDQSEAAVIVNGQDVAFTLLGVDSLTYTATAPGQEGSYTFSGVMRDSDKVEQQVGGASSLTVRAAPAATQRPAPTATPQPTATPAPTPQPTATPKPTATRRPAATIVARPTVAFEPTATPTPEPTATATAPAPATTAPTPEPTPLPVEPVGEEGTPLWLMVLVIAGAVLVLGGVAMFARANWR